MLHFELQFHHNGYRYEAEAFVDPDKSPYLFFVILMNERLIKIYGREIFLKTDLEKVLPTKASTMKLDKLRHDLLTGMKATTKFQMLEHTFSHVRFN
ncbi:MAG TPA: hypothetical protein VD794_13625 [Flavisolibacter sp.]|nr:hypothetical protein [Flavisolibacter sp.]